MITTKAIAFPSGGFPSIWTRIELHSSAEQLENNTPWPAAVQQRASNA
jgi:hypothetical protein